MKPTDPITEAWLRNIGAYQIDSNAKHWLIASDDDHFDVFYFPKDDTLRLYVSNLDDDGKNSLGGCHTVTERPTIGHVLKLCAGLPSVRFNQPRGAM